MKYKLFFLAAACTNLRLQGGGGGEHNIRYTYIVGSVSDPVIVLG